MKTMLSLMFACLFFCSKATFLDKVNTIQGKVKTISLNALNTAKKNKTRTALTSIQLTVFASRVYTLVGPQGNLLFTEDRVNLLSTGEHSPLGQLLNKLYKLKNRNDEEPQFMNKGLKPLTYIQNVLNHGTGATILILEFLKKLVPIAE